MTQLQTQTELKTQTLAYVRVSTDRQELANQKLALYEGAGRKGLTIDRFIESILSSRKTGKARRIDEMVDALNSGDVLMVTELSRLGRSTNEVIALVNLLIERGVRIIALKENLDFSMHSMQSKMIVVMFSLFAEIERDLISARTKESLAERKSRGIALGKPAGTIQKSKFDKDADKIKELLAVGLSVRKIAGILGYSSHEALNTYISKRKLRE